jgi:hypothetical protein
MGDGVPNSTGSCPSREWRVEPGSARMEPSKYRGDDQVIACRELTRMDRNKKQTKKICTKQLEKTNQK